MLDRQFVIGARDRAFQQAPDILNAIRMDVATDVFFDAMVDDLMLCIMVTDPPIGPPIVRDDDFGIWSSMLLNESMQCLPICSVVDLQPDFSASLNHATHDAFVLQIGPLAQAFAAQASANKGF